MQGHDARPAGRVRKATCGHCYAGHPRDELKPYEGALLCTPCHDLVLRKTGASDETQAFPADTAVLKMTEATASRQKEVQEGSDEERLRTRLTQLEYERKRRPDDPGLLRELLDLYQRFGLDDLAIEVMEDLKRIAPSDRLPRAGKTGRREAPDVQIAAPVSTPFWEDLPAIAGYALRGRMLGITLVGGLLLGGTAWLAGQIFLAILLAIPIASLLAHFFFEAMRSTALGGEEPPAWPDLRDPWGSLASPLLASVGGHILYLGPSLLWGLAIFIGPIDATAFSIATLSVLLLLGILTMPMALLAYGLIGSLPEIVRLRGLYAAMGRILPDYCLLFAAWCVMYAIELVVLRLAAPLIASLLPSPITGSALASAVTWTVIVYLGLTRGKMLGRLYHQAMGRLRWFDEPEEPRHTLGPSVIVAGAGGPAILIAAVVGLLFYLPGGPLGGSRTPSLPFEEGSYLIYEVQDPTFGNARVRYDVAEDPEGFRIRMTTTFRGARSEAGEWVVGPDGTLLRGRDGGGPAADRLPRRTRTRIERTARRTFLCGPTRAEKGDPYLNGFTVQKEDTWRGVEVFRSGAQDLPVRFLHDEKTGVLVGAELLLPDREVWCVLGWTNVPGLRPPED